MPPATDNPAAECVLKSVGQRIMSSLGVNTAPASGQNDGDLRGAGPHARALPVRGYIFTHQPVVFNLGQRLGYRQDNISANDVTGRGAGEDVGGKVCLQREA